MNTPYFKGINGELKGGTKDWGLVDNYDSILWITEQYCYSLVFVIMIQYKIQLVEITKKKSDMGPPRKFFTLNDAGREELKKFWEKW